MNDGELLRTRRTDSFAMLLTRVGGSDVSIFSGGEVAIARTAAIIPRQREVFEDLDSEDIPSFSESEAAEEVSESSESNLFRIQQTLTLQVSERPLNSVFFVCFGRQLGW